MKRTWLACLMAMLPAVALPPAAHAAKSDSCAHCHGTDGNSSSSAYPSLAGQTKAYLFKQIKAFKDGERKNSMMSPAAAVLSEQEMMDLAEYFNSQTLVRSSANTDPALVAEGKKLAEQRQCASCHQPGMRGLDAFPRLSRQKYPYLVKQIKDFRDGARTNDGGVMLPNVKDLTDKQVEALAQYLTSL
jgi:cytochrome c553